MKKLISNKLKIKKIFSFKLNKKILFILGFIGVLILGTFVANIVLNNQGLSDDKYTVLKLKKNINKINAKGEIKSEDSTNVYSNVNLPIKEVKIKLGDKVKTNNILAILDTSKLEDQIKELESSIVTTNAANQAALENANSVYNNALVLSSNEKNQDIKNAETALNEAKRDYENKKSIYDKYKQLHESEGISDQELKTYEISYENSEDFYEKSKITLNNIKAKVQQELVTAKTTYEAAKAKAEDSSQHITLENLKKDLNNAEIKAPVDGIISAKTASVGNQSTGILFEIMNPNNVTVNVEVKEVDIEKIKVGQKAEIKSDSTGGKIIEGEVVRVEEIAKTEDNNKLDLSNDSNDKEAKYEVKLKINDPTIKLKIGMKAQADIISKLNSKDLAFYRRDKLGFIFQFYNLVPNLTVKENIEVCEYLTKEPLDKEELLKTLGLWEHQDKFPRHLSGGQQQRTAIARALIKNPKLLLCDEPTGALDYNTSKEILELLEAVNKKYGTTMIIVTHNDAIKYMSHKVIKVRDGRIEKEYINEKLMKAKDITW